MLYHFSALCASVVYIFFPRNGSRQGLKKMIFTYYVQAFRRVCCSFQIDHECTTVGPGKSKSDSGFVEILVWINPTDTSSAGLPNGGPKSVCEV